MPLRNVKLDANAAKDAPPSPQRSLDRPTATDIYEQVSRNARRELTRPWRAFCPPHSATSAAASSSSPCSNMARSNSTDFTLPPRIPYLKE